VNLHPAILNITKVLVEDVLSGVRKETCSDGVANTKGVMRAFSSEYAECRDYHVEVIPDNFFEHVPSFALIHRIKCL